MLRSRSIHAVLVVRFRALRLLPPAAVTLATLGASSTAIAQGTSVLTGTVVDASTKRPIRDVVVTASSPDLQGEQTVVSDRSGTYRLPNLPTGMYTLRFDADNYHPNTRGGITLRVNATLHVNAEILPENIALSAEEILVVAKAPTVDIASASSGVTMTQDFTSRLPLSPGSPSRSFESLAIVAPGAQTDAFGVSINGTTSPENAFVIDGVSVNNPALGTNGSPLSTQFIKEFNVVTAGYLPEYGRSMGGIFDVVTQSGGNEFHGSVYFDITPGAFEGPRRPVFSDGTSISTNPALVSTRDFGATIGGPIQKDKLWFFAGVQAASSRRRLTRTLSAVQFDASGNPIKIDASGSPVPTDPQTGQLIDVSRPSFTKVVEIPGASRSYYNDSQSLQYIGKLTYLLNQDHTLTLSVSGTPSTSGGNGTLANTAPVNLVGPYSAYAFQSVETANDVSLKYSGAFNNKHQLVDVILGFHHQRSATLPADGSALGSDARLAGEPSVIYRRRAPTSHSLTDFAAYENIAPGYCDVKTITVEGRSKRLDPCQVASYLLGGPGAIDDASLDNYQARIVATSLFSAAGHHVVKGGVDLQVMRYAHSRAFTGGARLFEDGDGAAFRDARYGLLVGPDQVVVNKVASTQTLSTVIGGFVQDSFQLLDKVTINAGLRYDAQVIYGADGTTGIALPNQWSPRIGVIYDFTQQGRSKVYAYYGRFYETVPLTVSDIGFPGPIQIASRNYSTTAPGHAADGCDPAKNPSSDACRGDRTRISGDPTSGNGTSNPNQIYGRSGGDKAPVDPDLSAQSSDQIVVGGEYEILPDARLGLNYTHSSLRQAIEDMSRDESVTYFIGNPGTGIAKDFPKPVRDYDAVTLSFTRAFLGTWLAQVSYTYASLRGNYAGLFRAETGQFIPNATSDFDLRSLMKNRSGPLAADRSHNIKIYAAKDVLLPAGQIVNLGLGFTSVSGEPLNYLGAHPLSGRGEVYILPRGAAGRGDWIHSVDTHLGYGVRLGKQSVLSVNVDVFNLFNFQGATSRDQLYTRATVLAIENGTKADLPNQATGSPGKLRNADGTVFRPDGISLSFLNPLTYQDPRQIRLGARVTF